MRSDFEAGDEGWLGADLYQYGPYYPPFSQWTPTWEATGGNPDGDISVVDPSGEAVLFSAPAMFLGNQEPAYGTDLTFDLRANGSGSGWPFIPELVLVGDAGRVLVAKFNVVNVTTEWQSFSLPLEAVAGWYLDDPDSGPPASEGDLRAVLADLEALYICADYVNGNETIWLDNVVLRGTRPGDLDHDGQVTIADFDALADCLNGPIGGLGPTCDAGDVDADGDVDLEDFAEFQRRFGQ